MRLDRSVTQGGRPISSPVCGTCYASAYSDLLSRSASSSCIPACLIFTSRGIRIAEPRLRLNIDYSTFSEYTFSYEYSPGGRSGPDVYELVIKGPIPWRSPSADSGAELIASDLGRIKELVAG